MCRIAIVGNAGAGKSTLGRAIGHYRGIKHVEIDRLLWQPGWVLTADDVYDRLHQQAIAEQKWVIDGLGKRASIPERISRATEVILVDMPLWMHFWLAAERQIEWSRGPMENAPGGVAKMPPTRALFQTMWEIDQTWMPEIRVLCEEAERAGKPVTRLMDVEALTSFAEAIGRA